MMMKHFLEAEVAPRVWRNGNIIPEGGRRQSEGAVRRWINEQIGRIQGVLQEGYRLANLWRKSYESLPPEAKKTCDRYVRQGLLTKEQYIKEYFMPSSRMSFGRTSPK